MSASPIDPDATTGSEQPTPPPPPSHPRVPYGEKPGDWIGPYKLLELIGEGGFGTVYRAEQAQPHRHVALKLIREGLASASLLRRFEAEAEILGRLQHPGIAQIFEAGTFDRGRGTQPFFAMELIKGTRLTEFARERALSTRQRLGLLIKICDAVQHAHARGIIHRDLKPANILVTDDGEPKILDFGVARATDSDVQQTTMQTDVGQLIGTVPYMSPEQVSGDPDELDTRSDVYALGVIAYELLAGRLPYDLQKKMIHEAARIIKEEEPTRLSSIDRRLRGDVETIVAKALEKDKARRYQSAESLASDISRHLTDQPITARPASTWYQVAKFTRRNRGLVAGLAMAFILLIVGLAGTSYGLWQAVVARNSESLAKVAALQSEAGAKLERDRARSVTDFVVKSLQSQDPNLAGSQDMTVAHAMTQAADNLSRGELKDQPETAAELLRTIANILNGNGRSAEAQGYAEQALKIVQDLHSGDHPDVALSLDVLASVRGSLGDMAGAEQLLTKALEICQRLYQGDHRDIASAINNLAGAVEMQGRLEEAEALFRQALEMDRRLAKSDDIGVASDLNNLARVLEALGRAPEAEPLLAQALEMRRRLFGDDHPGVAESVNDLAMVRESLGREADAEILYQRALEIKQHCYRGDHPHVAAGLINLAIVRRALGRAAEAEPLFEQAAEMYKRLYQGDHPYVAAALNNLANVRESLGRTEEAEALCTQALEMNRRVFPGDHERVAANLNDLARMRRSLGRPAEAEELMLQVLEMNQRLFKGDHPNTAVILNNLADIRLSLGRGAEAEAMFLQALEMSQRLNPGDHPITAKVMANYARCLAALSRYPEAMKQAQQGADMAARSLPEGHPLRQKCDDALAEIKKASESKAAVPGGGG